MDNHLFTKNIIEAAIRLFLVGLLLYWCALIMAPFVLPVLWGAIIAVAIFPLFKKFTILLGGRIKLAAVLYTLIALALLIVPAVLISTSLVDTSVHLTEQYQAGKLDIPQPTQKVADWPLIGEKVYHFWSGASHNLERTVNNYLPQIKELASGLMSTLAGMGGVVLQFILSIIISGVFVANAESIYAVLKQIFGRLVGEAQGESYTDLAKDTIRSVAQGVLGVAVIQAGLSAIGMYFMDVPAWALWALLVLVLAIAQLPPILVLGLVSAYVFSVADTTPAVIFLVYCLLVSMSDGFLKPIFLGRGMDTPMLVILLGAIGGMLMSGIIGLFVGAIILALGYELFMKWLTDAETTATMNVKEGLEGKTDE